MIGEGIAGYCQRCEEEVLEGDPCVTINLHTEIVDRGVVDVKHASTAVMLCTDCGVGISEAGLRQAVEDYFENYDLD